MGSLGNKIYSRSSFYKITILTQPHKGGTRQDLPTNIFEFIGVVWLDSPGKTIL